MKQDFLADYVAERLNTVRKALKKFRKSRKQKHIHNLRVSIKELRAIFHFADNLFHHKSFPKKPFKKLYKAAGKLREAHINLGFAERFHYSGKVIRKLQAKQQHLSEQFEEATHRYQKKVKALDKKTAFPKHKPRKKEMKHYFEKEIHETVVLLHSPEIKKELHLFRKKIKTLLYVYAALSTKRKKWTGLNEAYLNKLQLLAGKWHDTFAAIAFFEQTHSGSLAQLAALKRKEKRQRKALLQCCHHFQTKIYA